MKIPQGQHNSQMKIPQGQHNSQMKIPQGQHNSQLIYKTLLRKVKIEQQNLTKNRGELRCYGRVVLALEHFNGQ